MDTKKLSEWEEDVMKSIFLKSIKYKLTKWAIAVRDEFFSPESWEWMEENIIWTVEMAWRDLRSWFRYRLIPRHRYHIIRTGLRPGYYDIDYRILHGMFSLLVDYVEKEKCFERIDWDWAEDQREVFKEIRELYHWWKEERPSRKDPLDEIPDDFEWVHFTDEIDEESGFKRVKIDDPPIEIKDILKRKHEADERWMDEDDNNLIRLVKIRRYLWT